MFTQGVRITFHAKLAIGLAALALSATQARSQTLPHACCHPWGFCYDVADCSECADASVTGEFFCHENSSCPTDGKCDACCRSNADCDQVLDCDDCDAAHETCTVDAACANVYCVPPSGACCQYGVCSDQPQAGCENNDGTYGGDFSTCDATECCGNGQCLGTENCTSCPQDCGCTGPCQTCTAGVCGPSCGNGTCEPTCGESCSTCAGDCTCNDNIGCTTDACEPGSGFADLAGCTHTTDLTCCTSDGDCNDGYDCTSPDECNYGNGYPGFCQTHRNDPYCADPRVDTYSCTEHECVPDISPDSSGCITKRKDANCADPVVDSYSCTDHECVPDISTLPSGCISKKKDDRCDDYNLCTRNECNPDSSDPLPETGTGCVYPSDPSACGACCYVGFCEDDVAASDCSKGEFHAGQTCVEAGCVKAGACCLDDNNNVAGTEENGHADCLEITAAGCERLGGAYEGDDTLCEQSCGAGNRISVTKKGSVLIFPKVELKWDQQLRLKQDTILTIVNDTNQDVRVKWYFVNGDEPLDAVFENGVLVERAHAGWKWVDCITNLTAHESSYLTLSNGYGPGGTCSPFTLTDPQPHQQPQGRYDPHAPVGHRYLRGFAIAIAIDENGEEICWNHLTGAAEIVAYNIPAAWEYSAYAAQAVDCTTGDTLDHYPGKIKLDGDEYDYGYNQLVLDFFSVGSTAMTSGTRGVMIDAELTLLPLDIDLRQDNNGPTTTKAEFDVYNQNEDGRSGMTRCISCWSSELMSSYAITNHFIFDSLQTDFAKTRINGVGSEVCDDDCEWRWVCDFDMTAGGGGKGGEQCGWTWWCEVRSQDSSLVGVVERILAFSGAVTGTGLAGTSLVGMGIEDAKIRFDIPEGPDTQGEPVNSLGDINVAPVGGTERIDKTSKDSTRSNRNR